MIKKPPTYLFGYVVVVPTTEPTAKPPTVLGKHWSPYFRTAEAMASKLGGVVSGRNYVANKTNGQDPVKKYKLREAKPLVKDLVEKNHHKHA